MFSFFPLSFSFLFIFLLDKRNEFGVGLEILQTLSKLICFFNYFIFSLEKRNEFGVTLEILQTLSKLSPNALQTHVLFFAMSQPKKLLVQEALQSSASNACSAVYELLETSPPRVTPEKQEFGL